LAIKLQREVRSDELYAIPADPTDASDLDEIAIEDRYNADFRVTQPLRTLATSLADPVPPSPAAGWQTARARRNRMRQSCPSRQ